MVVSETNGRVRVRHGALKNPDRAGEVRGKLLEFKGVLDAQVNRRVGSLLVTFDKAKVSMEKILARVAEILHLDIQALRGRMAKVNKAVTSPKARRWTKRGMAGTLGGALAVVAYSEKYHVVAGGAFLGLLGLHLYQNRRTLMR